MIAAQDSHLESVRALLASPDIDLNHKAKNFGREFSASEVAKNMGYPAVANAIETAIKKRSSASAPAHGATEHGAAAGSAVTEAIESPAPASATNEGMRHRRAVEDTAPLLTDEVTAEQAEQGAGSGSFNWIKRCFTRCCRRGRHR